MPEDTRAAREALEKARLGHDGTYSARYAEWKALADRDLEAHLAPYRALPREEQERLQAEGLAAANRVLDRWLDLREQLSDSPRRRVA